MPINPTQKRSLRQSISMDRYKLNNHRLSWIIGLIILFASSLVSAKNSKYIIYKVSSFVYKARTSLGLITKLRSGRQCLQLRKRIISLIPEIDNWSVTIIDSLGNKFVDINGEHLRIPASNQKLLTTAYALDKLGPYYSLDTTVSYRPENKYIMRGNGNPDLSENNIQALAEDIAEHISSNLRGDQVPHIIFLEEDRKYWWPNHWIQSDRNWEYGAPITRLAYLGNSVSNSLHDPLSSFHKTFTHYLSKSITNYQTSTKLPTNYLFKNNGQVISIIKSSPMQSLLSLSNSESHNFTSEVLLRQASKTWDTYAAITGLYKWLARYGLSNSTITISDGSGLSRTNKVSTNILSSLLYRMNYHPLSAYYFSSMAILGKRGTLSSFPGSNELNGIFVGKTGTLTNVRALSGVLKNNNGNTYISIIGNNVSYSDGLISRILVETSNSSYCH